MNMHLFQKELGRRIAGQRKQKGFTQADLATRMQLSRSSLAQIELGNRNLDAVELQQLAIILGFSLDDFMSEDFKIDESKDLKVQSNKEITYERMSKPHMQPNKIKNVLLYMLEKCAGKPNVGETVLYKLLYFADFNYYELYEEHLTGAAYRKLPYGPVPQNLDVIINQMIADKQLQRFKTEYFGLQQTRFLPLVKANLSQLKASEKEVIDKVLDQMSDWSAAALSAYSHKDMPWLATKEGDQINYELAFYREAPYSVRNYDEEIEEQ